MRQQQREGASSGIAEGGQGVGGRGQARGAQDELLSAAVDRNIDGRRGADSRAAAQAQEDAASACGAVQAGHVHQQRQLRRVGGGQREGGEGGAEDLGVGAHLQSRGMRLSGGWRPALGNAMLLRHNPTAATMNNNSPCCCRQSRLDAGAAASGRPAAARPRERRY